MAFYRERYHTNAVEFAFMTTQWERVGYRLDDRCAVLRGATVNGVDRGRAWEFRPDTHSLFLSSYHLSDRNMALYVRLLHKYRPKFIRAYPSALELLAKFMLAEGFLPPAGVEAILCGSEPLYPSQRSLFADVFQCRVFSWYGHSEYAVLAGECECSQAYHVFPEYGYCELIDDEGRPVVEEGGRGELVATSFHNYAFPFIRYRTGDIAVWTNRRCDCGRECQLLEKVEGRRQEYIVTKDGRWVTLTALVFAQHFEAFAHIRKMQLEQSRPGRVALRIVRGPGFCDADAAEVVNRMVAAVEGELDVETTFVEAIPPTRGGTHRLLIQHLPLQGRGLKTTE
jgi:phenylacetate-CoA ligase